MNQETSQPGITYKINAVELLNLTMNHPSDQNVDYNAFHFDLKLQHRVSDENKLVFVITNVTVKSQDQKVEMATLQTSCIFAVENFENLKGEGNKIQFPQEFLDEINALAISTTRGVMYSHFKGTFLHKAVLPVFKAESLRKTKQ